MDIHLIHSDSRMSEKLLNIFFKVETTHWWWLGRKYIIAAFLEKYLHKNKNNIILDAGCGTGSTILYLQKFGKVYGLDISPTATQFCRQRGLKNIKNGDISKLPFENNFFNLICVMDVLEHIRDDKVAINEIVRVLKPNGIALLTVPALPFIYSKHDLAQGHFRRYTKAQIRKLLTKSGLKELKTTYFNSLLSLPIIITRLLSKVGGPFEKLSDFDSKLNYDISQKKKINQLLMRIFMSERTLINYCNLPFGVSILAIFKK